MGRKGGGRASFMKSAMRQPQSDSEEEVAVPTPQDCTDLPEKSNIVESSEATTSVQKSPAAGDETKGQMTQRHKREQKALKDQVKRMGKKGKEEGAKLIKELEDRHAKELAEFEEASCEPSAVEQVTLSLYAADLGEGKKSKAQKRRERLLREEQEREERIAAENEAMGESERESEEKALLEKLSSSGLVIEDIPPDGHCLYRSIEDQIQQLPDQGDGLAQELGVDRKDLTYLKLRQICADSLRSNKEDFIHFLAESDLQVESDDDPYEAYCSQVQDTAAWGGHIEIQALALALKAHVRVHTADMTPVDIGEEFEGPCIQICYLKHAYGLGEHYNSTRPVDMTAA